MNREDILYPVFLEFTHHVADEYWKLLYEDMAFGKFPGGVYVQKDHFCCFHKGKEFCVRLDITPVFDLFTQVHSLLHSKMGIQSDQEKTAMKEKIMQQYDQQQKNTDDQHPKRLIKDSIITSFVLREGEKYRIPDNILRRIFSLFIIGFMFKTILVKDVIMVENEIQAIQGFHFSDRRIRIQKNALHLKKNQVMDMGEVQRNEPSLLSSHWQKYTSSLSLLSMSSSTS